MENFDGIDDVDSSTSGRDDSSRSTPQFRHRFDLYLLHYLRLISRDGFELQKVNVILKTIHGVRNASSRENGYISQEEDRGDGDIHHPVADQEEVLNPHSPDSSDEAENISIADNKRILLGAGRAEPRARIVSAQQEQGGLPSFSNRAHSIAPSGSHIIANFITFMSVLTSLCYNSESISVDTEMNNAAGSHAYCFGNTFVSMNALYGSPAVPVLLDSAQVVTQSFENAVASNDDDDSDDTSNDGSDNNLDDLEINFPM